MHTNRMIELKDTLDQLELLDLRYFGPPFTWTNKRPLNPIAKKLDRALVNLSWFDSFPNSLATFAPHDFSDHTPCTITLHHPIPSHGTKPFKFLNHLTKHPKFIETVESHWIQSGAMAENLSVLSFKLKSLKPTLKDLNRENFSNIQLRVSEANSNLNILQVQVLTNPSQSLFEEEQLLQQKLSFLRTIEEDYFRQKSRINWLRGGDHNTSYFHRIVKTRNSNNAIHSFSAPDGSIITNPRDMSLLAVKHFQDILAPIAHATVGMSALWIQDLTEFRCPAHTRHSMVSIPAHEEITSIVTKLNPNKAPGPDGLTAGFFKSAWQILGSELLTSIVGFFATGFLPQSVNATILALIPKKPGATALTDYRPISCCNTLYKIISKLLVVRLKPIMHNLILPNQTAFVKGRLLVENTLLATEIIQGYHSPRGPPRLTIKVDLAKAFDTVSWDFILTCLRGIEVPELFLRWIKACICTPSFSLGFNGLLHGYFKGKRGLRQGDPLSPYLFVIAMNGLSLLLNKAARDGRFGYHSNCEAHQITHLCFADDLLIFTDGSLRSVSNILAVLDEFRSISGLSININKTSFFAAGLSMDDISSITQATGLTHAALPATYLGLPLSSRKLSAASCAPMLQKIKFRMSNWAAKTLSYAGRLQLIKSVVNGITNFWMTAFILPKACIKEINGLCGKFLWKGNIEAHHSARVSWNSITLPKEEGGLGLRDLDVWSKICFLKLIWMIFFRRESLWVAWFRKYVLDNNLSKFWVTNLKPRFTWHTRKLLKYRDCIFPWIHLKIGNGRTCSFWHSNWSPFGRISTFLQSDPFTAVGIPATATLSDLWQNDEWYLPPARSEHQVQLQTYLSTISLSNENDQYEWQPPISNSSGFTNQEMYAYLRRSSVEVTWHSEVWFSGAIPRHAFLSWLFVLNRSPTRDRLCAWGLQVDPLCLLCNREAESRSHLFFDCEYSAQIWTPLASALGLLPSTDWDSILFHLHQITAPPHRKTLMLLVWQASIYFIWQERNHRYHRSNFWDTRVILRLICSLIRKRASSLRDSRPRFASLLLQNWFAVAPSLTDPP